MIDTNSENISQQDLYAELEKSKSETIKYVNKLLEVEEKWAFINLLLKKLNSTKKKQEICDVITSGFLELTESKACVCVIFNPDNAKIENKSYAFSNSIEDKDALLKKIEQVNSCCAEDMKHPDSVARIGDCFTKISNDNTIIVPISYSEIFCGYLMLIKEESGFYKDNIKFINVFPEHIALILENISLYQESEKRNKQKIEFLASISHEFKTPLNSIIGFADILKNSCEKIENTKYINNILQGSKFLLTLIEDVLDVSKSQYKLLELNYTKFSSKDEILKIILSMEKMIQEKEIELKYTLVDLNIDADLKRFKQLMYNFISNAIKFNKLKGHINILTYVEDNKFFCEVSDTGDGISKKDYDKIFDFFSQVNRSQLKRQLGSGVGLALCKRIISAHKGEIGFNSQIKKGSTFWFSLPLSVKK